MPLINKTLNNPVSPLNDPEVKTLYHIRLQKWMFQMREAWKNYPVWENEMHPEIGAKE